MNRRSYPVAALTSGRKASLLEAYGRETFTPFTPLQPLPSPSAVAESSSRSRHVSRDAATRSRRRSSTLSRDGHPMPFDASRLMPPVPSVVATNRHLCGSAPVALRRQQRVYSLVDVPRASLVGCDERHQSMRLSRLDRYRDEASATDWEDFGGYESDCSTVTPEHHQRESVTSTSSGSSVEGY